MTMSGRVATEMFGLIVLRAHEFGDRRDLLDPGARVWLAEALRRSASRLDPKPPQVRSTPSQTMRYFLPGTRWLAALPAAAPAPREAIRPPRRRAA
jgi:hypothetical protein